MTDLTTARKNARTDEDANTIAWAQDRILELEKALQLPLLFHNSYIWTKERSDEWEAITGTTDVTTKQMCDHIRMALAGSETYDYEVNK